MANIFSDGKYFSGGLEIISANDSCLSPVPVAGAAAGAAAGHAVGVLVAAAEPHQPVPRVVQDQRPAA